MTVFLVLTMYGQCLWAKTERLTAYLADSTTNTGIAVVVCPGGSYCWHDMNYEGRQVAEWLQARGEYQRFCGRLPRHRFGQQVPEHAERCGGRAQ